MQQPMEQRVGALEDKVRDHDQLLDHTVTISGQLTSLQDQLQGVVIRQQASLEDLQASQEQTAQQNARLMNLLLNLARRYGWDEGLDEDEEAPASP